MSLKDRPGLTLFTHADPEKHFIGESLPAPSEIISTGAATVGISPIAAREDHFHGGVIAGSGGNNVAISLSSASQGTGAQRVFTGTLTFAASPYGRYAMISASALINNSVGARLDLYLLRNSSSICRTRFDTTEVSVTIPAVVTILSPNVTYNYQIMLRNDDIVTTTGTSGGSDLCRLSGLWVYQE